MFVSLVRLHVLDVFLTVYLSRLSVKLLVLILYDYCCHGLVISFVTITIKKNTKRVSAYNRVVFVLDKIGAFHDTSYATSFPLCYTWIIFFLFPIYCPVCQ